jgi:hypothetical protein
MRRTRNHDKITAWAQTQRTQEGDEWVLMPMGIGDHGPAALWPVDAAADPDFGPLVLRTAQDDTDARECDTRYELRLARDGRCVVSHAIRCRISNEGAAHDMGLDGSAGSVIAQMQRHNEAMMRQMIMLSSTVISPMQEIMKAQHERILHLEGERARLTDAVAALPAETESSGIPAEWMELAKAAAPIVLEAMLRPDPVAAAGATAAAVETVTEAAAGAMGAA